MSEDRQAAPDGQEQPSTRTEDTTAPGRQPPGARLPGRRGFLLGAGGLAAAALMGPGGRWLSSEQRTSAGPTTTQPRSGGLGPLDVEARRARALELRITTAQQQLGDPFPQPQPNGDEDRYANDVVGLANFTKALPHNDLGEVGPAAYRALLRALRSGRSQDFRCIPLGGSLKLVNPEGAFSFELQGPDPWQRPLPAPPTLNSEAFAGEMTECYWLALARDIPYSRYGQEPITAAAIQDLRRFADYQGLDARTLFRATDPGLPGVSTGPYLSQFLLQPYVFGSTPISQRYRTTMAGSDHLTSYPAWLAVQNGPPTPTPRFIRNGRDLAETGHQLPPRLRNAGGGPAELGRLVGEAVPGDGRQHQMERVRGAAAVRGRVGERLDGLEQLDDRAGPAMGHDQRQRALVPRAHVDEVDVDPVNLGPELRQCVQLGLEPAPVVPGRPEPGERLSGRQLHTLRAIGDQLHGGPACRGHPAAQRGELLVGNLDPERVDPCGVGQSVAEAWRRARRRVGDHAHSAHGQARRNPAAQQLPSREPRRLDQHLRNLWRLGGGPGALGARRSSRR